MEFESALFSDVPYLLPSIETVVTILIVYLIKKYIIKYIIRAAENFRVSKQTLKPLEKLILYTLYFIAFLVILGFWGVKGSLSTLFATAGFAGIVVGFAVQQILGNFFSGLILIFDKHFNIGDVVEINGISGRVEDITLRATTIMTWDGELVVIPNSKIVNEIIKNRSLYQPIVRVRVPVGVAYESDMEKVIKVCSSVLESFDEIEKTPKPQVVFERFGDSSIDLELRFWVNIEKVAIPEIKTKVSMKLKEEFDKNKIEIPYPHVEIIKKD